MKIHPRYYPAIILIAFVVFALIGFLLGFRPRHGNGNGESSMILFSQFALIQLESIL